MSAVPKSGSVPLPMMETTKAAEGTRELGVPDGVRDAVAVLVLVVVGVGLSDSREGDADAVPLVDGDTDGVTVKDAVGVALASRVDEAVADGVGGIDDDRDAVCVDEDVAEAVVDGAAGAHATPRKAVLGAAVASGEPSLPHRSRRGSKLQSAAAVTA